MNDLLERYLGAVCSYFTGKKKKKVYQDLKRQILSSATHYDELEEVLVMYGHPRSVALSYGYKPFLIHIYNPFFVSLIERWMLGISFIYLFLSTFYYLQQLKCLPFQSMNETVSSFNTSTLTTWILSHPILIMTSIISISIISLLLLDMKHPVEQYHNTQWTRQHLSKLPHPSQYPHHTLEYITLVIFIIFFFFFGIFFSSHTILEIQHSSSQMIHLMTYFFQPFVMIIFLDYFIDITKKQYTRKYIKYSSFINTFILITLTFFVINSQFLKSYLLPFSTNYNYILADIFIVGALIVIYSISFYKLLRNLKAYRSLFRK